MPKPLRLTPAALIEKQTAKASDIVLIEDLSSVRTFSLRWVTQNLKVGKIIYKMPPDSKSILQINSRTATGEPETTALKKLLGCTAGVVVKLSPQLVDLVGRIERKKGYPIKAVFAKGEKDNLFLCHIEPLILPIEAQLEVYCDLLDVPKRSERIKILQSIPLEIGAVQTKHFDVTGGIEVACKGIPAYPGLVVADRATRFVSETTSPADVGKMKQAKVMLTGGGLLSHAALLAASEGIPCVVGLTPKDINWLQQPGCVSVDAHTGAIYFAPLNIKENIKKEQQINEILHHAKEHHTSMDVYANAESPNAIKKALASGAKGIGLFRTEHMYQDQTELLSQYIEAAIGKRHTDRRVVLSKLLEVSIALFGDAFDAVEDNYIAIRLLDAPLNEFSSDLKEQNPMLGLRGCRFGILFSDFYAMQMQAIATVCKGMVDTAKVGIMIPLVSEVGEVIVLRDMLTRVWMAANVDATGLSFGTMIETPRACLISGELAAYCDFLSYGTNDLTQLTFGISRDDATYLPNYADLGVLDYNPFEHLDARGVGRLLYLSAKTARMVDPKIKLGICGNHAGDPESIALVDDLGFDYISCTHAKLPVATLSLVRRSCSTSTKARK